MNLINLFKKRIYRSTVKIMTMSYMAIKKEDQSMKENERLIKTLLCRPFYKQDITDRSVFHHRNTIIDFKTIFSLEELVRAVLMAEHPSALKHAIKNDNLDIFEDAIKEGLKIGK